MSSANPLKLAYAREHPGDLATYLATQGTEAINEALEGLPPETAAAVVAKLPQGQALRTLAAHGNEVLMTWLDAAESEHALALLLHLDDAWRASVLAALSSRRKRRTLERLLYYPRETVGALANPSVMRLNGNMLLEEAIAVLQGQDPDPEAVVWVVDDTDDYLVSLSPLQADTSLSDARDLKEWLRHTQLPVTDRKGRFLGALGRRQLVSALSGVHGSGHGLVDNLGDMARQYFRIMAVCLDDLFGLRGGKR